RGRGRQDEPTSGDGGAASSSRGTGRGEERAQQRGALDAGPELDSGADVEGPGAGGTNGFRGVQRGKASGHDRARARGTPRMSGLPGGTLRAEGRAAAGAAVRVGAQRLDEDHLSAQGA